MTEAEILERIKGLSPDELEQVLKDASLLPPVKPGFAEWCKSTVNFPLHEWQEKHLLPLLESLLSTKGRRVLIHAPPQYGKSLWVSQRFPAYAMGWNPDIRVRLACYNITKAAQFGATIKEFMQDPEYVRTFGEEAQIPKTASAESFYTAKRSQKKDSQPSFIALGLQSGFVGQGADLLIIDDPYASPEHAISKAYQESLHRFWFKSAVPRLGDDTNVLVMFHRWHDADLASMLLEQGFEYYRFPALADGEPGDPTNRAKGELLSPIRSQESLEKLKADDPDTFYSLFQGLPRPSEGRVFKPSDFEIVDEVPPIDLWYRGWDIASSVKETADFSAGCLIGADSDQTLYIKDVIRLRAEFPDLQTVIRNAAKEDGKAVPIGIEEKVAGLAMIQSLARLPDMMGYAIHAMPAKGDKKQRSLGWAARARMGKLKLVRGSWNQAFINECLAFDGLGLTHDDQVDAVSVAFAVLHMIRGGTPQQEDVVPAGTYAYYEKLAELNRQNHDGDAGYYGDPFGDE
jgi:predicted phage terminase large subunit-like protein